MDIFSIGINAGVAIIAFAIGVITTRKLMSFTLAENRQTEWRANEEAEYPGRQQLAWSAVHVRDDLGSLTSCVAFATSLLLAILVVLIVR